MRLGQICIGILLFAMSAGCEKRCDSLYNTSVDIPDGFDSFDIDGDGRDDFYSCSFSVVTATQPNPESGRIMSRYNGLCADNGYTFLHRDYQLDYLQVGDSIKVETDAEQRWRSNASELITNTACDGLYLEYWEVIKDVAPPYYLGIKKEDGTGVQVGWMELEYDLAKGSVHILDTHLSTDSVIVFK